MNVWFLLMPNTKLQLITIEFVVLCRFTTREGMRETFFCKFYFYFWIMKFFNKKKWKIIISYLLLLFFCENKNIHPKTSPVHSFVHLLLSIPFLILFDKLQFRPIEKTAIQPKMFLLHLFYMRYDKFKSCLSARYKRRSFRIVMMIMCFQFVIYKISWLCVSFGVAHCV